VRRKVPANLVSSFADKFEGETAKTFCDLVIVGEDRFDGAKAGQKLAPNAFDG